MAPDPDLGAGARRPLRPLADRHGLRAVLRHHQRRGLAVRAPRLRPDDAGLPLSRQARLPPHRGPGGPVHRLDRTGAGDGARKALLPLSPDPCGAHAAPRAEGLDRPLCRPVRRRLGRPAPDHLRAPDRPGRHPRGHGPDRPARRDPGLGGLSGPLQAHGPAADGGLRRLPRPHRPPHRPPPAVRRGLGPGRQHPRRLHHRRQRRLGGGDPERRLGRALLPERRA